jgi:hypothetical protein
MRFHPQPLGAAFPTSSDLLETSITAFMVEIKSSKRTAQPASPAFSAHPNNSDDLIPSGDLPARDIQAFLN